LTRALRDGSRDPNSASNGYYFDAVAVNLYCSPFSVYRVHGVYTAALAEFALEKPIWLTETNCPVYDDASAPMQASSHITTIEQSAYLLQSVALARAAGYQRIGWYGMVDHDPGGGILDRYGLLRPDNTPRPAYSALKVATRYLGSSALSAQFAPVGPGPTPDTWEVWRVVLDEFIGPPRRVQVLWRTPGGPASVDVEAHGRSAYLIDLLGRAISLAPVGGNWRVPLPPPRVRQPHDPAGYPLFGNPVLLVEDGFRSQRSHRPSRLSYTPVRQAPLGLTGHVEVLNLIP
jgi:hypothetical protein